MTLATAFGTRVAEIRRRQGKSQKELAAALGRSESWMSQVERGIISVDRLSVLQSLADILGVPVSELRAEDPEEAEERTETRNELDEIRLALTGHPSLEYLFSLDYETPEVGSLHARVEAAWELTHAAKHAELSTVLPSLLRDLEFAVRDLGTADRAGLYQELASAYQAASAAFARQDEADASWVAADRGIRAAEAAGMPLWVLAGHFRMTHAFIRLHRFDQAERVVLRAIEALEPTASEPGTAQEVLSLLGALHLAAAVLRAREGNRPSARGHLDAAEEVAARLDSEDRNDFGTEFGTPNVLLHRVSIAADLGDAGEALDAAAHVNTDRLSPERQARYWLDVARCHAQRRQVKESAEALLKAEALSPELTRAHNLSRQTIGDLIRVAKRPSPELVGLAERAGVDL